MKSLYLLPLLLLAAYSCNTKSNLKTPEKFVDALISSINSEDSVKFRALYVTGEDIEFLIKNSKNTELISRLQSENKIIMNITRQSCDESFAAIAGKDISIQTWELSPYETDVDNSIERIRNLEFQIETPDGGKKVVVIREIMKIGDQWKAVSYINVEELYAR